MNYLNELRSNEITIVWENLSVFVPPREESFLRNLRQRFARNSFEESLKILKGVSGYASTGSLIAIMGPSGAGKTTFLASLADRIASAQGSVKINGQQVLSQGIVSKISGYLPQFDALPAALTVEEHLLFMYALKTSDTAAQRRYSMAKLLIDLNLIDCRHTLVSKLSGGQKKRLSLGAELVTTPRILFLDEPTTGLDTFSAMQVGEVLKGISLSQTIVFCTIHQPGMDIYNLFTHVIFMSDGKIAYFGTLKNATTFFSSLGFECPVGFNESEYYIKVLSVRDRETYSSSTTNIENASMECIDKICQEFSRSPLSKIPEMPDIRDLDIKPQRRVNCIMQFSWLMWRMCIQSRRTLFADWISWLSYFLSVAAVGTFYAGINPATQMGVQNVRGALYMMSSEISFTVAYSVIYEFPGQVMIYLREGGVYGCGPYYIATFLGLVTIPKATLKALIFTAIFYFVVIAETELINFLLYCLTISAAAICGTAYGLLFSSWIESIDVATSIMVPVDMLFLLTAGMFYNLRSLPAYLTCFKYLSTFFYLNEALAIIYWSRIDRIDCDTSDDMPCLKNGEEVLLEYGFEKSNLRWDLCGLMILTIAMGLVGYIGVRRKRQVRTMF
ncbi:protein brown [Calliopsis andreniformis]|uniref:protein brown n=1 Tax=Calliopsis andreniformis TaxID=337506 RepID=UPI003FCD60E2